MLGHLVSSQTSRMLCAPFLSLFILENFYCSIFKFIFLFFCSG